MLKKLFAIIMIAVMMLLCSCGANQETTTAQKTTEAETKVINPAETTTTAAKDISVTATVVKDEEFGGAILDISPEEFTKDKFTLGDSCNLEFSNGQRLESVPFYNGYYGGYGEPVIVAYPGNDYLIINFNYGALFDDLGLNNGDTVKISLNEPGKYKDIQETLGQEYSCDITEYGSTISFCNFRALTGGEIKKDFFYRGASPVDNKKNRAPHTDTLIKETGIKFIMDLADTEEKLKGYMEEEDFNSPYAKGLYSEGRMALLNMNMAYRSDDFKQKFVSGLLQMMASEGPVYIHCLEGKDRTGFVCVILEALAGASYEEMQKDYMLTYENYYKVTKEGTPKKYDAIMSIYFNGFMKYLSDTDDIEKLKTADYKEGAKAYLISGGMSDADVEELEKYVCE